MRGLSTPTSGRDERMNRRDFFKSLSMWAAALAPVPFIKAAPALPPIEPPLNMDLWAGGEFLPFTSTPPHAVARWSFDVGAWEIVVEDTPE